MKTSFNHYKIQEDQIFLGKKSQKINGYFLPYKFYCIY